MLLSLLGLLVMTALMLFGSTLLAPGVRGHPRAVRRDGTVTLRPPRGRNAMLAGLALGPTLLLVAVLAKVGRAEQDGQAGLALAVGLLALGGWLVLWLLAAEFRQYLKVSASSIERVFAVTHLKVTWAEVERFRWNPSAGWFFIVAAGAWLWVPANLDGIEDFARLALLSLPPAVLNADPEARPVLQELARDPSAGPWQVR
jgi:hypothetical protein